MRIVGCVTLLALAAAPAVAQQHMGRGAMSMSAMADSTFEPTIGMLKGMLKLTPDQVRRLQPYRDTLLAETRAGRDSARAAQDALRAARRAGAPQDSLAAARARVQAAMMALMPARMRFHERIRPVLTAEQAAMMDRMHDEHMAGMPPMGGMGRGDSAHTPHAMPMPHPMPH